MDDTVGAFYDRMAEYQHLVFADWNRSIEWQADVFGPLIEQETGTSRASLLDCACGIGTQALGLARRGHLVTGTDLSPGAIVRARREAALRDLHIRFEVADMRQLDTLPDAAFDAVIAADNALPHLPDEPELRRAARSIASKLRLGSVFIASIRDYDMELRERRTVQQPSFCREDGKRRIVHQVWDWSGERAYTFHLYITRETAAGWECLHSASTYRAIKREELTQVLSDSGFHQVRWLMPPDNGFYQPIVLATLL